MGSAPDGCGLKAQEASTIESAAAKGCLVIMYHYVRDLESSEFPALKALDVAEFETQLDWLQERCDVVGYTDFEAGIDSPATARRPTALLTFDDGIIDHYEQVFPILRRRGLTGVFFILSAPLEGSFLASVHGVHFLVARLGSARLEREVRQELTKAGITSVAGARQGVYRYDAPGTLDLKALFNYDLPVATVDAIVHRLVRRHLGDPDAFGRRLYLEREMIAEMAAAGMTFGGHTARHRMLSRICPDEQRRELQPAVSMIRGLTRQMSVPFCYPYGHRHTYTDATAALVQELGYSAAFNVVREPVVFGTHTRYELPRLDTKDLYPFKEIVLTNSPGLAL